MNTFLNLVQNKYNVVLADFKTVEKNSSIRGLRKRR